MNSMNETYEKVAKCCSEFLPEKKDSVTNSTSEGCCISCCHCKHFDNNCHCRLDLYDKIVAEKNL